MSKVIYVRTDRHGDDVHGDGSRRHPFRTVARARSDYPDDWLSVNDVVSTVPPQQLTELGEPTQDSTGGRRHRDSSYIAVVAGGCGLIVGYAIERPLLALLAAAVLIAVFVWLDGRKP